MLIFINKIIFMLKMSVLFLQIKKICRFPVCAYRRFAKENMVTPKIIYMSRITICILRTRAWPSRSSPKCLTMIYEGRSLGQIPRHTSSSCFLFLSSLYFSATKITRVIRPKHTKKFRSRRLCRWDESTYRDFILILILNNMPELQQLSVT